MTTVPPGCKNNSDLILDAAPSDTATASVDHPKRADCTDTARQEEREVPPPPLPNPSLGVTQLLGLATTKRCKPSAPCALAANPKGRPKAKNKCYAGADSSTVEHIALAPPDMNVKTHDPLKLHEPVVEGSAV